MSLARKAAVEALAQLAGFGSAHVFYAGNAFIMSASRRRVRGEYRGDDMLVAADLLSGASRWSDGGVISGPGED
jgi:hypothetical protein